MTTIANGLLGGLVVGLLAAAAASLAGRSLSSDHSGESPLGAGWRRPLAFVAYGTLAGGALVALELYVLDVLSVPPALSTAMAVAIVWAGLLFGAVAIARSLASSLPVDREAVGPLLAYHVVYGVGLGLWIRLTWIT